MLRKLTKPSLRQLDSLTREPDPKLRLGPPIALTAVGIVLLAVLVGYFARPASETRSTHQVGSRPAGSGQVHGRDTLSIAIRQAQNRLHDAPTDKVTWAGLGSAYLQQARITGDPTYYPKAEGALQRSLALDPANNWQAMTALGALANARHDFTQALGWARRAAAVNPGEVTVYAVMDEALTQLGDYPAATTANREMLELQPGITAFTRASTHFEQHGDPASARKNLLRALALATEPTEVALCRYNLGELAFHQGNPKAAFGQYQLGLDVDPSSVSLLAGRAKAEVALGRKGAALHDYAAVIKRSPRPHYILENAELLLSLGRDNQAEQQFTLLAAKQTLQVSNGVVDDLLAATVEADHGSATAAVRHAEAEWARRKSVLVADALGWALHRAGRDHEALGYATRANRLGWRNAAFSYHLGMIELALGRQAEARRDLGAALKINPYFSVLQAPVARMALTAAKDG